MLFPAQVDLHWLGVACLYMRMFLVSSGNRFGDERSIDGDGLSISGKSQARYLGPQQTEIRKIPGYL